MCPCWVHDLAVTRDHVVIVEPPMYISLPSLMSLAESDYVFMDWKPEMGTRVHVVPLSRGAGVSRRDLREHRGFQKGEGSAARHPSACLDFSLSLLWCYIPNAIRMSPSRSLTLIHASSIPLPIPSSSLVRSQPARTSPPPCSRSTLPMRSRRAASCTWTCLSIGTRLSWTTSSSNASGSIPGATCPSESLPHQEGQIMPYC